MKKILVFLVCALTAFAVMMGVAKDSHKVYHETPEYIAYVNEEGHTIHHWSYYY